MSEQSLPISFLVCAIALLCHFWDNFADINCEGDLKLLLMLRPGSGIPDQIAEYNGRRQWKPSTVPGKGHGCYSRYNVCSGSLRLPRQIQLLALFTFVMFTTVFENSLPASFCRRHLVV